LHRFYSGFNLEGHIYRAHKGKTNDQQSKSTLRMVLGPGGMALASVMPWVQILVLKKKKKREREWSLHFSGGWNSSLECYSKLEFTNKVGNPGLEHKQPKKHNIQVTGFNLWSWKSSLADPNMNSDLNF
jgi:hypothetical protein